MRILISGVDSYIGNHIADWLQNSKNECFEVDFLDVRQDDWIKKDFCGYDAIVHVAGIVHRKDITDASLYRKVNTDLPVAVAAKAKEAGVKQFVFLSTMAVYGIGKKLKKNNVDITTPIKPNSLYGKSKFEAERQLQKLEDGNFIVTIVRPPNVYGKGCKGGYITGYLSIVKKIPVIPDAYSDVKQSVLYIDNLCEFIRLVLVNGDGGIFLPQDEKPISAVELMSAISHVCQLKKNSSKLLGLFIYPLAFLSVVIKGYGGIAYPIAASKYSGGDYVVVPFSKAIKETLG